MHAGDSKQLQSARIVIAVIGSLGDLHPALAIAHELQRRGHSVTIATTLHYRSRVEALGLDFYPMRPHWDPTDPDIIAQCEDIKRGIEVLFRQIVLPHIQATYDDLLTGVQSTRASLLIAGEMVYAAPLVAEKFSLPRVSLILSPASFLSAHDPSVTANVPSLIHLRKLGWPVYRAALNLGRFATRHWWDPVRELRRREGLSPACDPLFKDKFSPQLTLALFSRQFAKPQPDWPSHTLQPGFIFYDDPRRTDPKHPELDALFAAAEAPIVFTLGSTVVHNPGSFYQESIVAAMHLGKRALLIGANPADSDNDTATTTYTGKILRIPYASYADVFPHASVIVHQGGSGTTAHALRAGRPMLVVPYGWDQPDNGARVQRLGAGLCIARTRYNAESAAAALTRLLSDPAYARKTAIFSKEMRSEDSLTISANAIESLL